jgi:hypothetical protein
MGTKTTITKKTRSAYATRFHRDGSVTVWSVYSQQWLRTSHPSHEVLASLDTSERARVIRHCGITS